MVYVRISEGLGNQLFKYACAYAVAKKTNDKMEMDLSEFANGKRMFALDQMNITATDGKFASPRTNGKLSRAIAKILRLAKMNWKGKCKTVSESKETYMHFAPYDFTYKKKIYIRGYWQNPKYFEHYKAELIKEFSPKDGCLSHQTIELQESLKKENSVAVHIRRGDYCKEWLLGEEYYMHAINCMKTKVTNPHFYIFCEDYEYAKKFSSRVEPCTIINEITEFTDLEEFYLISSCKNQIIANSTFSWWAAYLNQNPEAVIIAPLYKQWGGRLLPG
jgi:hypothetical protein